MSDNYDTTALATQGLFDDEPRDRPLLMGYEMAPELIVKLRLSAAGDRPLDRVNGSIIADVLIGHRGGQATSFSLHRNKYTALHRYHPDMTYANVRRATFGLDMLGLIEVEKGRQWKDGGKGKQSRCWASDLLLDLVGDHPILTPRKDAAVLILRDTDKAVMGYTDTRRTLAMATDVREQNEAIRSTPIRIDAPDVTWREDDFVTVPGLPKVDGRPGQAIVIRSDSIDLRRIGNNGSWTQGMRFYGHFAQGLPKARRRQLTIGGMPVELIDFRASHPSILYAQAGVVMDGDPYEVDGFPRDEVKLALLILINAANRHQGIEAMAGRLAQAEAATDVERVTVRPDHRNHARRLFAAVSQRHVAIATAFCSGAGIHLQYVEAEVIGAVMRAARRLGIVTLPVHDEIVCAAKDAGRVQDIMTEAWVQKVGQFPDY